MKDPRKKAKVFCLTHRTKRCYYWEVIIDDCELMVFDLSEGNLQSMLQTILREAYFLR